MKYKKCNVTKTGEFRPCYALKRAAVSPNQKGISIYDTLDFKTGNIRILWAQVKSGEFAKKGLILNYCPFCGESIAHHLKKKEE